jgi:hypothetical protein
MSQGHQTPFDSLGFVQYYKKQYEEAKKKKLTAARDDDVRKQREKASAREIVSMQTSSATSGPGPTSLPAPLAGRERGSTLPSPARTSGGLAPVTAFSTAPLGPLGPLGGSAAPVNVRASSVEGRGFGSASPVDSSTPKSSSLPTLRKSAGGALPELLGSIAPLAKDSIAPLSKDAPELRRAVSSIPPAEVVKKDALGVSSAASASSDESREATVDEARSRSDTSDTEPPPEIGRSSRLGHSAARTSLSKPAVQVEEGRGTHVYI